MKTISLQTPGDSNEEIARLIEILHQTGQRLEQLTGGEVDSVMNHDGHAFLLQHSQDQLRLNESARQAAILNALPASIALLDSQGIILSVNEAWQQFSSANAAHNPGHDIGVNYLIACDKAQGDNAAEANQTAAGIRAVLSGKANNFTLEYPCHYPAEQRWFLMTVTPLVGYSLNGVVVMHLNITERKTAEDMIVHLNRVLLMLSSVNALIVRVNNRDELFREACNIAVGAGGFRMAMVMIVDPGTMLPVLITSAGKNEKLLAAIKDTMSSREGMQKSLVGRAMREKKPVITNDTQNDPGILFGGQYNDAGVNSVMVIPLIVSDEAVGTIVLYASEIHFFQKDEIKLLTELAGDVAYAIDHIDKQERLNYLAYYDVLTGLANRTLFLERVAQYMRIADSGGYKLALGVIDLERFKSINDSLGRSAGDALLKQVAEWLTQFAQDANLLARIDADHFAIVLPEVKSDGSLAMLIEKLMAAFQEHSFELNGAMFRIGIKIGFALFPDDGSDVDILYRNAEAALNKAKEGSDRFLFYKLEMNEAVAGKLELENQLRRAIDREEFVLHYQPKVNLKSGKVTSAEALIRWNDPRTGLVSPDKLIPTLEETGMISEVGHWALHQAINDTIRWRAAGLATVRIAVNLSQLQLRNTSFIEELRQMISLDMHVAEGLELEITESLIMDNVELNIASLQAIRAMGITIAIDDFGTGFSSLNYLSKLPVDTLKIDRAFVIEMDKPEGLTLVNTIIVMAHALNIKVVAEGVETEQQMYQLRSLDCDEMQGFLFSKPVPAEIFESGFLAPLTANDKQ